MIMVTGDSGMARGAVCLPRFTSEHFTLFSIVTAGVGKAYIIWSSFWKYW